MPAHRNSTPSLRRHKPSRQGVVTLSGRDIYLGSWPEGQKKPPAEVRDAYDRAIAEWLANRRRLLAPEDQSVGLTVSELILSFWKYVERHYRHPGGEPTSEVGEFRHSLRPLRQLYGPTPAAGFGPLKLKAVRHKMVEADLCRTLLNRRVGRIVRMFKWAVSEELIPESVHRALQTVRGLEKGRGEARESEPVEPVADADVDAVLPFVLPPVRAMIQLQRLTGMRPAEARRMRACDLEVTATVWLYRPAHHKTQHRGKSRVVALGPKAQHCLRPFLRLRCPRCGVEDLPDRLGWREGCCAACHDRREEAGGTSPEPSPLPIIGEARYLFSPREAMANRRAEQRARRKTKVQPSQERRKKRKPKRQPGEFYGATAYDLAIYKGCDRAGVRRWHPHQLRHTHATEVRRLFGLEAAQVALGHSQANVTEVYAQRDLALAVRVAREIG
jgi:integrase